MDHLQTPTVTPEDLLEFHANHFPGTQFSEPLYTGDNELYPEHYREEDNLGYYDDGVKRTLTDEQISIFRHSEIHALLRERQRRREEAEEEAEETPDERIPRQSSLGHGNDSQNYEDGSRKEGDEGFAIGRNLPSPSTAHNSEIRKRSVDHDAGSADQSSVEGYSSRTKEAPRSDRLPSDVYAERRIVSYADE